jgi:hypothetical protein
MLKYFIYEINCLLKISERSASFFKVNSYLCYKLCAVNGMRPVKHKYYGKKLS